MLPDIMSASPLRVCVIGAGAAGLAALRHLTAQPHKFRATAYEQTDSVGGTWVYTDSVDKDSHGLPIHSSVYKYMK
jgi:cation diffusion facilitator CzcD-associated flavoprotein CzcO